MPPVLSITSRDNQTFRYAVSMHNRKKAKAEGLVFIEGVRLCEDALMNGSLPKMLFFTKDKEVLVSEWEKHFSFSSECGFFLLPDALFEKLSMTKTPQGIALLMEEPIITDHLPKRGQDIYLVCEQISDPGNMGAMIRMADAFDFTAVLMVKGTVDPFNEKVLRASMGSVFHIPIVLYENVEELFSILKKEDIQLIGTHLKGESLDTAVFSFPCAFMIGNEAKGMSSTASLGCDMLIKIPMEGKAESLNASTAASIVGYELSRRRRSKTSL